MPAFGVTGRPLADAAGSAPAGSISLNSTTKPCSFALKSAGAEEDACSTEWKPICFRLCSLVCRSCQRGLLGGCASPGQGWARDGDGIGGFCWYPPPSIRIMGSKAEKNWAARQHEAGHRSLKRALNGIYSLILNGAAAKTRRRRKRPSILRPRSLCTGRDSRCRDRRCSSDRRRRRCCSPSPDGCRR